jgi:DNA repair protein RadC
VPDRPHFHAHRERLRARFLETGGAALADYELLELLLFLAIPRQDVKPLAKALIGEFGSFAGVLAAEPARLRAVAGVGPATVTMLKAVYAAAGRVAGAGVARRDVIGSWDALLAYCRAAMAFEPVEQFRVLFLDRKNGLIADEAQARGTVDQTAVYPREVMKRALEVGAAAIILVHNHPSGDPTPSAADVAMTRAVAEAGEKLGIAVHDHVVVGSSGHASFRALGLL